ncbi:relaxase/mobilization nuclease domain-containing protein [Streptomyces sp. SP17BM10]|uniref:relaxase/mobilization nuclease domain-containing protein n=1 Tax=Streptomyces sp. SP17BM10 TaxID=3002530 RepID=UPI002E79A076|nr:relaxase/mobilization nuclease domain-containing protein [Streptomyces sp. SP17BM10]MEE1786881.1 relaxase/mobilization nuclease domain-containing protein [Streptomyces sp. SP17BM10]
MIPSIKASGGNTRGLLAYLYGPGRHDEHLDPHIVASFSPLGLRDPGRDQSATLTQLARILDEPVNLRNSSFGKKVTDHVWHCPVRAAPGDRYLSDAEWGEIARRIVHAAGIAPDRDPHGCRWIAVRHADDHIHILATTVREDGRRPKLHGSGKRAQAEARKIEKELGLHQVPAGDRTGERRPTQAEMHKADRLGWQQTSRDWLRDRVRDAIPHAADVEELLAYLQADGVEVKPRRLPSGDLQGYAVGRPGDTNAKGEQIYIPGGKLAPDLSLPKLRSRLTAGTPEEHPTARRDRPTTSWQRTTDALDTVHQHLTDETASGNNGDGALAQAQITALGDIINATAQQAPQELRAELRAATRAFARAQRSQVRADHQAAAGLRQAVRDITYAGDGPDGSALAVMIAALVWAAILTGRWHQARGHAQQAQAAQQAVQHLQAAYDHAAADHLAALTHRQPAKEIANTLAGDVRSAVPDHAQRILVDRNWPALATVLADAKALGHQPRELLQEAAARRELTTARLPAKVLLGRIQHTSRNPERNLAAEAARRRSPAANALGLGATPTDPTIPPTASAGTTASRIR